MEKLEKGNNIFNGFQIRIFKIQFKKVYILIKMIINN